MDFLKFNAELENQSWWKEHEHLFVMNPAEKEMIAKYNAAGCRQGHTITLAYPFEGMTGNPYTAKVVVLSHNPRADVQEMQSDWLHMQQNAGVPLRDEHWKILEKELQILKGGSKEEIVPTHCLNPIFCGAYSWWKQILTGRASLFRAAWQEHNLSDNDLEKKIADSVATLEIHGYHTSWFDANLTFPHTEQIIKGLKAAIENGALIFFRSYKDVVLPDGRDGYWSRIIPELKNCINRENNQFFVASSQRPFFTTNNVFRACDIQTFKDKIQKRNELKQNARNVILEFLKKIC